MKRVTLTDFRRHLTKHLHTVVRGEAIVLTRHGRSVARVERALSVRPAQRPFSEISAQRYERLDLPVSSTELLRQDRDLR